jgi:hypothetical protein
MSIIEGIDIYLAGVDYDSRHENLLRDTFDNVECRQELEPLWHMIDVFIDRQARTRKALFCDAEEVYMAIEDFCIHKNITNIPALYKYLFNARKGFLTQAKFPCCIEKQWLNRFPNKISPRELTSSPLVLEFKTFMENDRDTYTSVLIDLELFGYEFEWSDESSDEEDSNKKWMF